MKNRNTVTWRQIETLLLHLGFTSFERPNRGVVYEHAESGTVLLLPPVDKVKTPRAADIHSIGQHLIGHGLLEEDAFAAFVRDGIIPQPSQT